MSGRAVGRNRIGPGCEDRAERAALPCSGRAGHPIDAGWVKNPCAGGDAAVDGAVADAELAALLRADEAVLGRCEMRGALDRAQRGHGLPLR